MGQQKLLLPWGESTLLESVLRTWLASQVTRVVVVVRHWDSAVVDLCRGFDIDLVLPPEDPVDMKASVGLGLSHIQETWSIDETDKWMLAPADLPGLRHNIIDRVVEASLGSARIVAARYGDRRGHPILLPWRTVSEVFALAENEGVDQILGRHEITYVDFPHNLRPKDVDTPEQYESMRRKSTLDEGPSEPPPTG